MPWRPTTSWSRFPPRTTEVQFDEKWSFVAKKEANCDRSDPADDHKGDYRDHVAYDPEHRLVVAVVPGARDVEGTEALVGEFRRRTGGRAMRLMTSDAYAAYEAAILDAYGETVTPDRTGRPGRPRGSYKTPRADLVYATVEKVKGGIGVRGGIGVSSFFGGNRCQFFFRGGIGVRSFGFDVGPVSAPAGSRKVQPQGGRRFSILFFEAPG